MKRQLIHFLTKNTEVYREAVLSKARSLKESATDGAANASGEAFYQVIRIQAIASVIIFFNILLAISINYLWEIYFPESYGAIGRIVGFLLVFLIYLLVALLLPHFKKPVVRGLSRMTRRPVARQVDKRLSAVEQRIENFDTSQLKLPQPTPKAAASAGSSRKKQVKQVLIATGAGVAAMLLVRKLTRKKAKSAQGEQEAAGQPNRPSAAANPLKKAAVDVLAQAGKQLALEFVRGLSQKEDATKKEK